LTTTITICDTCKRPDWSGSATGQTDGQRFALLIEAAAKGIGGVNTRRHPCLMGCKNGCNIAIQGGASEGAKISYVLGDFEPDVDAAEAIVEYARQHAASDTGIVPYRSWPQDVKGHFVARLPAPDPARK